jgi:hypothetical protein
MSVKLFALRASQNVQNLYITQSDNEMDFVNELNITDLFDKFDIQPIELNRYVEIELNIKYKFSNFSPEVTIDIIDLDGTILYTNIYGMVGLPNKFNKILDNIFVRPTISTNISLRIKKRDTTNNKIIIGNNSFYKIRRVPEKID